MMSLTKGHRTCLRLAFVSACLLLTGCALDKQKHFAVGAAVGAWVYSETGDRSTACLASLVVGVAKEAYDARDGRADEQDALATVAGCSITWTWGED
jgi:hypothetical protein